MGYLRDQMQAILDGVSVVQDGYTPPDACPLCHGAEWLRPEPEAGQLPQYVPCACLVAKRKARNAAYLRQHSDLGQYDGCRLDALTPNVAQAHAMAAARAYAANPAGGLLLLGKYGNGKSTLAAAVAHEVLDRVQAVFLNAPKLLRFLNAGYDDAARRDRQGMSFNERMEHVCNVGLLVLDDLGTQRRTEAASDTLYSILAERYQAGRPTVATTNQTLDEMGERLVDRLLDSRSYRLCVVRGKSVRREGVERPVKAWPAFKANTGAATEYHIYDEERVVCPLCDCRPHLPECPQAGAQSATAALATGGTTAERPGWRREGAD